MVLYNLSSFILTYYLSSFIISHYLLRFIILYYLVYFNIPFNLPNYIISNQLPQYMIRYNIASSLCFLFLSVYHKKTQQKKVMGLQAANDICTYSMTTTPLDLQNDMNKSLFERILGEPHNFNANLWLVYFICSFNYIWGKSLLVRQHLVIIRTNFTLILTNTHTHEEIYTH